MGTCVQRCPRFGRLLVFAAISTAALGLAVEAQAAVKASVAGGKLTVTGTSRGERISLRHASGGRLVVDVGDNGSANFSFLRRTFRRITVNGGGGNDRLRIDERNGAFTNAEKTTLNGGSGLDRLIGGRFPETLSGGSGADTVDANAGSDRAVLGADDDVLTWNAGDGADRVDGGAGLDTATVNGTSGDDMINVAPGAVPGHVKLSAGPDLLAVETLALNVLAGADSTVVGDVSGTGLIAVNLDLGVGVGGAGDGAPDLLSVHGSTGNDVVQAAAVSTTVQVTGLSAQINVTQSEAVSDLVTINGLAGNDVISGGALAALSQFSADGGEGDDTINGGNGADTLLGRAGNDAIDGNAGADLALLGTGDDVFIWDPGDGSDIVEGGEDLDTLRFNGSAGAEIFTASSSGARLFVIRNIGNITMDTNDVETVELNALGGTDTVTVNDLTPTDADAVNIDLGVAGAGDLAVDALTVNGSVGADVMSVSGGGGSVTLASPPLTIAVTRAEPANDTLTINTSLGADLVGASGLASTSIDLTINGGADGDSLVGSQGHDTINGDAGNDYLNGGDGNDTLNGGADTDTIDGGPGIDTAANGETVINVP